ncbi:MAG: hypothetical protein ABSA10_09240 [Anaerolineales bacterium]|jgi:hypothetical protein
MTTDKKVDSSRRTYASLMRLYPQEFRDEYGPSMLQLFTDQCRSTMQENGTRGMIFLWLRTLMDLAFSVLREHIMSTNATGGLLEAVPNKPLPWKGVAVVLIPCLVFFVGQIGQLTGQDWFFLLIRRAAYFLIIPVLLVWLLTRKFPIWGLIPLGMFYRTLLDLINNYEYVIGRTGVILAGILQTKFTPDFMIFLKNHIPEIRILITTIILGTVVFLILRIARRTGFTRSSWVCLGVFLVVTILEILSGLIHAWIYLLKVSSADMLYGNIPSMLQDVAYSAFYAFLPTVGFLLLILVGMLLARRHGRLALLMPLGYLIPAVVLGKFDNSNVLPYSLFWISVTVLVYRVLVTLVAPIWIVRSASDRAKKRAGVIALAAAAGILVLAHAGYFFATLAAYGWDLEWTDYYYYFSPDLMILVGMALAITLYKSATPAQSVAGPTPVGAELSSG